jgi:hypothetical protein
MIETYFSDIYLIIINNHKAKIAEYKFLDAFPIDLSGVKFTYADASKINANVVWAHSGMYPTNNFVLRYV